MTQAKALPHPKGTLLGGNIQEIKQKGILAFYRDKWREHGDIFEVRFANKRIVFMCHPEHVNQVLVEKRDNYYKGSAYRGIRWLVGNGLFASEGEVWASQRRLMRDSFTMQSIKGHVPTMAQAINDLVKDWQRQDNLVDISAEMRRLTVRVISETMFGSGWSSEDQNATIDSRLFAGGG